jgi:hypothetical protein
MSLAAGTLLGPYKILSPIGAGESGLGDVAKEHDRHLADGETERWQESL